MHETRAYQSKTGSNRTQEQKHRLDTKTDRVDFINVVGLY